MHTKTFASVLALAALIGGIGSALPASAQLIYAPEPTAPLTAKDVSTRPPVLRMESIVYALGGPLQFEVKNGALVLTQTPEGIVLNKPENEEPENKVLWTGSPGTEPQKFALVTTAAEERIEDGTGKPIWSQHRFSHLRMLSARSSLLP